MLRPLPVGLVAPTAAEYRLLGANEPFLASLRAATGGTVIATPLDPWIHDLTATDRSTDLWPFLLVLALLLWPLDIALRRMSLGRRELAAASGWVSGIGRRRRAAAPRTAAAAGMFAASDRGRSGAARVAIRSAPDAGPNGADLDAAGAPSGAAGVTAPAAAPASAATTDAPPVPTQPTARPTASTTALPPETSDTMARLREAKRRARDR